MIAIASAIAVMMAGASAAVSDPSGLTPIPYETYQRAFGSGASAPNQIASGSEASASDQIASGSPTVAAGAKSVADGVKWRQNSDPSFVTIGAGWFDFADDEPAAEITAEWRGPKTFWIVKPFAGAMVTTDTATYGFGGFLADLYLGRRIVVTPSLAAGLYGDGEGKDLGSIVEFRSGLEIGWRFDNLTRLSVAVYHISNASISDKNPGTEIFRINYSFPLR